MDEREYQKNLELLDYYLDISNRENTRKTCLDILRYRPNDGIYLANYAFEVACLGQMEEAEISFKRAEEMEPRNFFVLKAKFIFTFYFCNDRRAEEELLARMLPLSRVPHTMNWYLALFHEKYNELEKAYEYCIKSLLANPQNEKTREKLEHLERLVYGQSGIS